MVGDVVEVAIVGCGPYGLAAASHLRAAGCEVRIFGKPLEFWQTHAPDSMLLRSPYDGSHIGDPYGRLTLSKYERALGESIPTPIPVERFVAYGEWVHGEHANVSDTRDVTTIERTDDGFRLDVNGDACHARRVVIAAGIGAFAWRPGPFDALDQDLASHTLDHPTLSCFAGRRVTVVGGGQSALESAALLHEVGADVDVVVRAPEVQWLSENSWRHTTWPVRPLLYSRPDVGPAFLSHLVAAPGLYRRLPPTTFEKFARRSIRPAGSAWLRPRLNPVRIRTNVEVVDACPAGSRLNLRFSDRTQDTVDHLMFGTGYRVDVRRYPFLHPDLAAAIACDDGYPRLTNGFETSVPGLHIMGAPTARKFGPLMRFVAGSNFAGRTLTQGLKR